MKGSSRETRRVGYQTLPQLAPPCAPHLSPPWLDDCGRGGMRAHRRGFTEHTACALRTLQDYNTPTGKKPAKSTPKVGRTGGGERRRKSECGSAERFVVSPEEVGSLCVISKVSSEAQRRLARSSDTRRGQRTLQRQARVSEASVRLSGKQQSFSCCPVSSSCACASAACVRTRSSDNVQPTRHGGV